MARLKIDDREVEVAGGATILEAARKAGVSIPTLCFLEGRPPNTSCMVCVVKVAGRERLVPACAAPAEEGMAVESESGEVKEARRQALELLFSDHLGDCAAPCHGICPAGMNIPKMIREIARGDMEQAIETVKADIPLPAVLGRICPAPCEKGCRRRDHDGPVAICLLKRYAADHDLASTDPFLPACGTDLSGKVAVVGAGPAGLSAAYYLRQEGCECTVFDDHEKAGGMLQYGVPEDRLPRDVLDAEIALIEKLGVRFEPGVRIGETLSLEALRRDFDAVLLACGRMEEGDMARWPLAAGPSGLRADRKTFETSIPGIFAAGDAVQPKRLCVSAVAKGKGAAFAIAQHLRGVPIVGPPAPYTTRIGKLMKGEIEMFMAGASSAARVEPGPEGEGGFTDGQAQKEAGRCLHCDCRKAGDCKLRIFGAEYGAWPKRFKGGRRPFEQDLLHPMVIHEPGKCIACGICIQISAAASGEGGLAFLGRGFDVRVAVPFGRSLEAGLAGAAAACAAACPTGALSLKGGR